MGLSDCCLIRFQNHLGPVIVDMKCSEDQDESGESLEMGQTTKHKLFTQGTKLTPPTIKMHPYRVLSTQIFYNLKDKLVF